MTSRSARERLEIRRDAHVAVAELDAGGADAADVELGAAPAQVVERDDAEIRIALLEVDGEAGADEAGAARDEHGAGHSDAYPVTLRMS